MKQSKSGTLSASMTSSDSGVSGLQNGLPSAQAPPTDALDAHLHSQLADGPVLARNIGLPVLFVVTKVRSRERPTRVGGDPQLVQCRLLTLTLTLHSE